MGGSFKARPLFRERLKAGMMIPLHSFGRGSEGAARLTEADSVLRDAQRDGLRGRLHIVVVASS